MRLLALALLVMTAAACSDRVPAPVTPTPSPRPGYPPAPISELPEGVLFVHPGGLESLLFRLRAEEEADLASAGWVVSTSPDGSHALTARSRSGGLVSEIGVITGSTYKRISDVPWTGESAIWSRDGKRLAHTRPDESGSGKVHVWILDLASGGETLVSDEAGPYSLLGWTGDGEVLARTAEALAIFGKTQRVVPLPEAGDVVDTEMSPDGRSVAVTVGEYEQSGGSLTYVNSRGIWVLGLSRGEWKEIVDLADEPLGVQTTGGQEEMQWSPDGRRMTVHRTRMDEHGIVTDSLSVLDVGSGEEKLVHKQGWGWESWSPDGRYLAYMYEGNAELGQSGRRLGILGPDGRKREVEGSPSGMAWAGNGRLLVDIPGKLSVLDPKTMEVEEVLTEDGKTISVDIGVWSPSGRYVAAETGADRYYRPSLYVIDTETRTAELFLDGAGFSAAAWLRE